MKKQFTPPTYLKIVLLLLLFIGIQINTSAQDPCLDMDGDGMTDCDGDCNDGDPNVIAPEITNFTASGGFCISEGQQFELSGTLGAVVVVDIPSIGVYEISLNSTELNEFFTTQITEAGDYTATITSVSLNGCAGTAGQTADFTIIGGPEPVCQDITVTLVGSSVTVDPFEVANANAPCGGLNSLLLSKSNFSCADVGENIVTVTAADFLNNMASCEATITVQDNTPPELLCSNNIIVNVEPDQCGATVSGLNPLATEACPGTTVSLTSTLGNDDFFPVGETTVSYSAMDAAANAVDCSFTVTVIDNIFPEILCSNDVVVDAEQGQCGATVSGLNPLATENCPGTTVLLTSALGNDDFFPVGETTVSYSATDASNNAVYCSFTVTVNSVDDITCYRDADEDGFGTPNESQIFCLNCGDGFVENSNDCDDTDPELNNNTEVLICPENISTNVDAGICCAELSLMNPIGQSGCETLEFTNDFNQTQDASDIYGTGTTTVTYSAQNMAGESFSCMQTVEVIDNIAPVFGYADATCEMAYQVCIANNTAIIVQLDEEIASLAATCNGDPTCLVQVQSLTLRRDEEVRKKFFQCFNVINNCSMTEVATTLPDLEITIADGACDAEIFPGVLVIENCAIFTLSNDFNDTPNGLGVYPIGTTTVTFTAIDQYGNESTATRNIIVTIDDPNEDGDGISICEGDTCPTANNNSEGFDEENCGCLPGYFSEFTVIDGETYLTDCTICPPGSYCPDGVESIECEAGSFSATLGAIECVSCEPGTFQGETGSTFCSICPAGTFSDVIGAEVCVSCPAGTFSNVVGAEVCLSCPAGSFSGVAGAEECELCPAGTYSDIVGAAECIDCESGTTSEAGAIECIETYCFSNGESTNYEWIESIALNGATNQSGADAGGYGDYTNIVLPISTGNNSIHLTPGFSGNNYYEYWTVYIDYNQNGAFEYSELVYYNASSNAINGNFDVPLTALTGETRMRISMRYGDWPWPCEAFAEGEVEDYLVNITFCDNVTDGGQINKDEILCDGNIDPAIMTSSIDANGGSGGDIEYLWLMNTTTSTPPTANNMNGWVEIPNSNSPSYDPAPISETTWYLRCARRNGCGTYAGESNVIEKRVQNSCVEYCESGGDDSSYEWIDGIWLADIDNTSGNNSGYADFTGISTNLQQGHYYTFSANPGYQYYYQYKYWRVWIDWNQDGDFSDSGEKLFSRKRYGSFSKTIYVPAGAVLGETRMRVSMKYGGWPQSCQEFQYGETEDYTINVTGNGGARQSPVTVFHAEKDQRQSELWWVNNHGSQIERFELERSADGTNFETIKSETEVVESNDMTRYVHLDAQPMKGDNHYRLLVKYDNGDAKYTEVRILNFADIGNYGVYPNPADEYVMLNLADFVDGAADIKIIDAYGKTPYQERVDIITTEAVRIDLKDFIDGVYFINVVVEGKRMVSKKLMINKLYGWR